MEDSETMIVRNTSCPLNCQRPVFSANNVLTYTANSSGGIGEKLIASLYYASTSHDRTTEYYTYGVSSLVADFGGYLGLLMGHSLMSLYDLAKRTWCRKCNRMGLRKSGPNSV